MPTSSIFTNIVINDPEKVEKFIDALEASSHDPAWQATSPIKQPLTDIEKIREANGKAEGTVNKNSAWSGKPRRKVSLYGVFRLM